MKSLVKFLPVLMVVAVTGCASNSSVDEVRAMAQEAQRSAAEASRAAADAQRSADAANKAAANAQSTADEAKHQHTKPTRKLTGPLKRQWKSSPFTQSYPVGLSGLTGYDFGNTQNLIMNVAVFPLVRAYP